MIMFYNPYQRYIKELLDEYGALTKEQLRRAVNIRFWRNFKSIDAYLEQMCRFDDFQMQGGLMLPGGTPPDYDVVRAFEVLLCFLTDNVRHYRAKGCAAIRFVVPGDTHDKDICIIPVRLGSEKSVSDYADDKFSDDKCEVVIFLVDEKEQIGKIKTGCNCKFAMVTAGGTQFFKR